MKCPNCNREIPEGHMYCDHCGTEINFVPDFEPEVENEINATLSGVADELNKEETEELARKERLKEILSEISKRKMLIIAVLTVIVIASVILKGVSMYRNGSAQHYLTLADTSRTAGNMDTAIEYLIQGNREFPQNTEIIFRLSDYYLEMGQTDEAVNTLRQITDSDSFSDDIVYNAYESIISVYKQTSEFDKIAELLNSTDDKIALSLRQKYVPNAPMLSPEPGTYEGSVTVTLSMLDGASNQIFYTVNGDAPDTGSIMYEKEIVLDSDGEYVVKAVSANEYGILSVMASGVYVVEKGAPAAPEIMEPSGEYSQNTMIVAVAETGCTIFYTTDGSDPTMESKQYISPITMPVGSSHFRFASFNAEGEMSEIVDREYHLIYTRLVSTEQAVNSLVSTLVRLDYLLDSTGKVRGIEGHNEYIYNSVIEIQGAGEYYVIIENHVNNDGSSAPTGLMYAVNTHDGTVNRLGYDSSGKYTLITISNR